MLTRNLDVLGTANDETNTFAYDAENRPVNVTITQKGVVRLNL